MTRRFFTEGRRKPLAQMCFNICQYLLIAAIALEAVKVSLVHRLVIVAAAVGFGVAGILIWPKED